MYWKLKATIQNGISLLPSSISYKTYYWFQRHLGALQQISPINRLSAGIKIWNRIHNQGYEPSGKVFFEVGTGSIPLVPIAYWLMGAKKTITIDLNPYLKEELVNKSLQYISDNRKEIRNLFGTFLNKKRFDDLLAYSKNTQFSIYEFLNLCHIDYIAPGDAGNTGLPSQSVDFHTSYNVFEHIPSEELQIILEEGNRIINKKGLFVNKIDYSDHFSHSDMNISAINFLQYSDDEWEGFAGNRYMYMNRLRHDDFINLFQGVGHSILQIEPFKDQRSQELLIHGDLQLYDRFKKKPREIISIRSAWFITKQSR